MAELYPFAPGFGQGAAQVFNFQPYVDQLTQMGGEIARARIQEEQILEQRRNEAIGQMEELRLDLNPVDAPGAQDRMARAVYEGQAEYNATLQDPDFRRAFYKMRQGQRLSPDEQAKMREFNQRRARLKGMVKAGEGRLTQWQAYAAPFASGQIEGPGVQALMEGRYDLMEGPGPVAPTRVVSWFDELAKAQQIGRGALNTTTTATDLGGGRILTETTQEMDPAAREAIKQGLINRLGVPRLVEAYNQNNPENPVVLDAEGELANPDEDQQRLDEFVEESVDQIAGKKQTQQRTQGWRPYKTSGRSGGSVGDDWTSVIIPAYEIEGDSPSGTQTINVMGMDLQFPGTLGRSSISPVGNVGYQHENPREIPMTLSPGAIDLSTGEAYNYKALSKFATTIDSGLEVVPSTVEVHGVDLDSNGDILRLNNENPDGYARFVRGNIKFEGKLNTEQLRTVRDFIGDSAVQSIEVGKNATIQRPILTPAPVDARLFGSVFGINTIVTPEQALRTYNAITQGGTRTNPIDAAVIQGIERQYMQQQARGQGQAPAGTGVISGAGGTPATPQRQGQNQAPSAAQSIRSTFNPGIGQAR